MQKFKRLLASLITVISLLALTPVAAHAEWKSNDAGWWYTEGNSWATNWRLIDKKWYYFYGNGYMAHDTTINGYNVNSNGEWLQQLSVITNNTNVVAAKSTDNIARTDLNNNTYKQDNKIVKEEDDDKTKNDNDSDEEDYNIKSKYTTNTSSSGNTSSSSISDDYYDYSSKSSNETYVRGYYRNGKYVKGHYRTKKDSTTSNNYSHKGNYNPHNGKRGYKK